MKNAGFETLLLQSLPALSLAVLVPASVAAALLGGPARFAALGLAMAWLLLLLAAAVGCLVVSAMKGPVRKGRDPYPVIPD